MVRATTTEDMVIVPTATFPVATVRAGTVRVAAGIIQVAVGTTPAAATGGKGSHNRAEDHLMHVGGPLAAGVLAGAGGLRSCQRALHERGVGCNQLEIGLRRGVRLVPALLPIADGADGGP
jgi:hypothetical protein